MFARRSSSNFSTNLRCGRVRRNKTSSPPPLFLMYTNKAAQNAKSYCMRIRTICSMILSLFSSVYSVSISFSQNTFIDLCFTISLTRGTFSIPTGRYCVGKGWSFITTFFLFPIDPSPVIGLNRRLFASLRLSFSTSNFDTRTSICFLPVSVRTILI